MPQPKGQNPNRPPKGSSIRVEPIRDRKAIARIKKLLEDTPREYCLFTLGINTAYRANELLAVRVHQVQSLQPGDTLGVWQRKVKKIRYVTINQTVVTAIARLLSSQPYLEEDYLFKGQRGVLTVPTVSTAVKTWCRNAGLRGNYGSHTLRKTWGYWQRQNGASLPLLMEALGHSTQQQTLQYLGIQAVEVEQLFELEL